MGICEGRVVVVTGAGRGIGREHALEFARQGAKVVVNDLGAEVDGQGGSTGPAGEVVDAIREMGGEAVANGDDVSTMDGAERLIRTAVDQLGGLDTLVCNAGILRDRMLVNMTEDDFDAVIKVHLKGHFCPTRHAVGYWREKVKSTGEPVQAALVFTSSPAGLFGNVGQFNYSAAKSGIATMARVAGAELKRYGVVANAISPAARTRMTETLFPESMAKPEAGQFDSADPANIAPLVVWLGSNENTDVTCENFEVSGGKITVAENWRAGPEQDKGDRWDPAELGPVIRELVGKSERIPVIGAR